MQSEGAVRQKLKQVRFRCQKKLIEAHMEPRPCNCVFNQVADIGGQEEIAVCIASLQGEAVSFRACDERLGGAEQAKLCPVFKPSMTKEQVKEEFNAFLDTSTLGRIAESFPDMAALMWALSHIAPDPETANQADLPVPPAPPAVIEEPKTFWKRLLSWDWS